MEHGSMTGSLLMIMLLGWLATRTRHETHTNTIAILLAAMALTTLAIAIADGYYWAVFPPANYYPQDDWRILGLTKNMVLAVLIGVAAFMAPEIWWQVRARFWPAAHFQGLNKPPECIIRIWPKSATAELSVRNLAKGAITVGSVQAVDPHNRVMSINGHGDMVGRSIGYLETAMADCRSSSWYPAPDVWVHGTHINGMPWSCRCKAQVNWPK